MSDLVDWLRLLWHRVRHHRAYRNGDGYACNTCDIDWPVKQP
jgi:hypothetical protein